MVTEPKEELLYRSSRPIRNKRRCHHETVNT
jgi:hypothetical protein